MPGSNHLSFQRQESVAAENLAVAVNPPLAVTPGVGLDAAAAEIFFVAADPTAAALTAAAAITIP